MIEIIIAQTGLKEIKGLSKTSQKPYHLRIQTGYAATVDKDGNAPPYPEKFELMLDADEPAYPVGKYTLHASSVSVDRDGRLAVRPRLTAIKPAAR